ncbi:unnamed protein product, partial [Staurois parvus]
WRNSGASSQLAETAGTESSGKTAGTESSLALDRLARQRAFRVTRYDSRHWGSPGIRSFGSPAGTASSARQWAPRSHQVRQRALSQLARQRAPDQRASSQRANRIIRLD